MLEFVIVILGLSLLLYTLLGGADFGAGIVETFSGKKGNNSISKAIAPIWEANHIWLILAIVILFNGFPRTYATFSTFLHIPLIIVLTGIILRGTAFTFRYYDVIKDNTGKIYSWFFRVSSFVAPLFLGICLGALYLGKIPATADGHSFMEAYISPWLNSFCLAMGIFTIIIFGTLAGVYLIGETTDQEEKKEFITISRFLFILLILSGGLVFFTAEINNIHLLQDYSESIVSMICVVIATVSIPLNFIYINRGNIVLSRLLVGMQVTLIFTGFITANFPEVIVINNGSSLTLYNTSAPDATLKQLSYALIVGVVFIIPSLIYLFKVFKLRNK